MIGRKPKARMCGVPFASKSLREKCQDQGEGRKHGSAIRPEERKLRLISEKVGAEGAQEEGFFPTHHGRNKERGGTLRDIPKRRLIILFVRGRTEGIRGERGSSESEGIK